MICPYCGSSTQVTNSRRQKKDIRVWRRRHCDNCGAIFTTFETLDMASLRLANIDSKASEAFSGTKLLISIYESCKHRKSAPEDARALTDTVINLLLKQMRQVKVISKKDVQR